MSVSEFDWVFPANAGQKIMPADALTTVVLGVNTAAPRLITHVLVANRDTIAHDMILVHTDGATVVDIGSHTIPAGQGYGGTPSLDLLALACPDLVNGLAITLTSKLSVRLAVAIQATFDISVLLVAGIV